MIKVLIPNGRVASLQPWPGLQIEEPEFTAAGVAKTSAAALSMITKEKHPMRALFFRDHEISGIRPAAAPSPVSLPGGPGKDLSTSNLIGRERHSKSGHGAGGFKIVGAAPFPYPLGIGEDDAGTFGRSAPVKRLIPE
jgi:hypothetical protein